MRRIVLVVVLHRSFDDSASCLSNVARVAFLVTAGDMVCNVVLIFVLRFVFDGEFRTQLCRCIRDADLEVFRFSFDVLSEFLYEILSS